MRPFGKTVKKPRGKPFPIGHASKPGPGAPVGWADRARALRDEGLAAAAADGVCRDTSRPDWLAAVKWVHEISDGVKAPPAPPATELRIIIDRGD